MKLTKKESKEALFKIQENHKKVMDEIFDSLHKSDFETMLDQLKEFHTAYGVPQREEPTASIPGREVALRNSLMEEENREYLMAAMDTDLVEIADALGDKLYVLLGTIRAHGLQDKIVEVFNEIHRSNMSKLDVCPFASSEELINTGYCNSPTCQKDHRKAILREDGKIMKGIHYSKPDIKKILETK